MGELRNVIVFTLAGQRYAIELRWIREIVTLGFVTNIPSAPPAIGGVCNLHGTILPVLDIASLLDHPAGPPPRQGDGALVLELDGTIAALRIDQVDHVASLPLGSEPSNEPTVTDGGGRSLPLLEPARLLRRASEIVHGAVESSRA